MSDTAVFTTCMPNLELTKNESLEFLSFFVDWILTVLLQPIGLLDVYYTVNTFKHSSSLLDPPYLNVLMLYYTDEFVNRIQTGPSHLDKIPTFNWILRNDRRPSFAIVEFSLFWRIIHMTMIWIHVLVYWNCCCCCFRDATKIFSQSSEWSICVESRPFDLGFTPPPFIEGIWSFQWAAKNPSYPHTVLVC